MEENIIEVVNPDYILKMENTDSYNLMSENITTLDYEFAFNKPSINSVELGGNKSAAELGLVDISLFSVKEDVSNKISSFDSENITDEKYFSAKCVAEEFKTKADIDLANLSEKGKNKFAEKADKATSLVGYGIQDGANVSLSNINATAQAKFDAKANKATTLAGYGISDGANSDLSNLSTLGNAKFDAKADKATTLAGYKIIDGADISLSNINATAQAKFDAKADKSTTLSGYGINDAYTKNEIDFFLENIDSKTNTLDEKLNISANNLNAAGKSFLSGLGMPNSTKYTTLSLGANDSKYTAPANGYFSVAGESSAGNANITLINGVLKTRCNAATVNGTDCYCFIPAKKGDEVTIQYSSFVINQSYMGFWFVYADGEV